MKHEMNLAGRLLGSGHPAYIIAEISANHRQKFDEAEALLRAAKTAGADAVKVQTYTPDTLTIDSNGSPFQIEAGSIWEGRTLYELYQEAYMPWEWQPKLKLLAEELKIHFLSTAYDPTAVDFLESIGIIAYKLASFELVDIPLIQHIAATGRPIIASTGMASMKEIDEAVQTFRAFSKAPLALLKCTSAYPAPPDEMNLRTIPHMADGFGCPVGLSDHTLGISVPVAGVALGACIVEKHLTLSRANPSPDSAFSLEPQEFKSMVDAIRTTEKAVGEVRYLVTGREVASRRWRRSLFVVQDMQKGEVFSLENVRSIRPADGLHPRYLEAVIGRHSSADIPRGTPLTWELLA